MSDWELFDPGHNDDLRAATETLVADTRLRAYAERNSQMPGACECGVCSDCTPFDWEHSPCNAEPISAISDSRDAAGF